MTSHIVNHLFFRQLFDPKSSTFTYLLADLNSRHAVLIDPVDTHVDRDINLLNENNLKLMLALNTHVHADHVSATALIKRCIPHVKSVISAASRASADWHVVHGDIIPIGSEFSLSVIATPGHTNGCVSYHFPPHQTHPGFIFTGDSLLIRGCGRTDFQEGNSETLFRSIWERLFTLPRDTLVYPAHDYRGMTSSTIREEITFNPRLGKGKTLEQFQYVMANLNLAYPKMIDVAVPANMNCGVPLPEQ